MPAAVSMPPNVLKSTIPTLLRIADATLEIAMALAMSQAT